MRSRSFFTALMVVLFALPAEVFAAGLWLPGHGAESFGRGSAVVAHPEDANALFFNPAGLALLGETELIVDLAIIFSQVSFQRKTGYARNGDPIEYDLVENEMPVMPVPQILFNTDLGTDTWALGFGLYTPWASATRYPEYGAQRYTIIDTSQSMIITQALALAWRPHPRVAVGASLQNTSAALDGVSAVSTYVGLWGEPEDKDLDAVVHIRAVDYFSLSGSFGLWGEPIDGLEIGASFQLPVTIDDPESDFETRLPSHYVFDSASVEGDTIGMGMELPWVLRAGLSYGVPELFNLEVDFTYEAWSSQDEIKTKPNNITITNVPTVGEIEADRMAIERGFEDSYTVSAGGSWYISPEMTARAGFIFEESAVPDPYTSLLSLDSRKFIPTLGFSYRWSWVALSASYGHIFRDTREITSSKLKQVNSAYPEGATIVGNGTYEMSNDILALGARFFF